MTFNRIDDSIIYTIIYFCFDIFIVQLLSDEFSMLSPATLESCGVLVTAENQSNIHLSDAEKKIAGMLLI